MEKTPIKRDENEAMNGNDVFIVLSHVEKHYPLHFHDFYELELAIAGEGKQVVNGNSYAFSHNTLFLFRPQDYHEIYADQPLDIYDIAFNTTCIDEETISNFLEFDRNIVIDLSPHKTEEIVSIMKIILDIYESNRSNKALILSHLLNSILLIAITPNRIQHSIPGTKNNNDILKYIQKNFARSPSLQEISDYCGYQKNYFCEIFKNTTGMTYVQYLTLYKLNYSKKLLKISKKSIKEISEECGFESSSNYIREFKKYNNITPKQYQKAYYSRIVKE